MKFVQFDPTRKACTVSNPCSELIYELIRIGFKREYGKNLWWYKFKSQSRFKYVEELGKHLKDLNESLESGATRLKEFDTYISFVHSGRNIKLRYLTSQKIVTTVGGSFSFKDSLKSLNFTWNPEARQWWKRLKNRNEFMNYTNILYSFHDVPKVEILFKKSDGSIFRSYVRKEKDILDNREPVDDFPTQHIDEEYLYESLPTTPLQA